MTLRDTEVKIASWFHKTPSLPNSWRTWLAVNAWWLMIVAAVLVIATALGTLAEFLAVFTTQNLGNRLPWLFESLAGLIFAIGQSIVLIMAIPPLRQMSKKGWVLLFVSLLILGISVVVDAILTFNLHDFIWGIIDGVIGLAIASYLLFEIRTYFSHAEPVHKKVARH